MHGLRYSVESRTEGGMNQDEMRASIKAERLKASGQDPSMDIVDRLRERAGQYDEYDWHGAIEREAADEIERLRELTKAV